MFVPFPQVRAEGGQWVSLPLHQLLNQCRAQGLHVRLCGPTQNIASDGEDHCWSHPRSAPSPSQECVPVLPQKCATPVIVALITHQLALLLPGSAEPALGWHQPSTGSNGFLLVLEVPYDRSAGGMLIPPTLRPIELGPKSKSLNFNGLQHTCVGLWP